MSLPRVNRSCTCEQNMHVMVPLLVNGSCTCEQDLQLTSASPHMNGTTAEGNAIKPEIHISISTYHAIPRQALSYNMPYPPGHTIYHAIHLQAIPYTMPCPAGHIIHHAKHRQAKPYTMPCPHRARPIYIPCDAHQTIPYTMTCPTDHAIYHAMSA